MQLQQNSNYRKYNSNSVPLNRRNQYLHHRQIYRVMINREV